MIDKRKRFGGPSLEEKRELLAQLLRNQISYSKIFPMSYAQQRLWFLDQLEPQNSAYNMAFAISISGALDRVALERALSEVVRRHETLRTHFALLDEQPVQIVSPAQPVALPLRDLRSLPLSERDAQLRSHIDAETRRPFDLGRGPLLRLLLLIEAERHVLVLVLHHIIFDGWSMGILTREVVALYEAYVRGEVPSLPEPPIQYADYAVWQREWLAKGTLETELEYWRRQLDAPPAPARLPTDFPDTEILDRAGAMQWLKFSDELKESLIALGQQRGVTPFMLSLAVFSALLSRLTGQDDIIIGAPVAGRNRPETEGLIGDFLNTLPLRLDLSGNPTFGLFLERVREVCLEAYAHQDLPFEKLVEELQPSRSLARQPFFDILFNQGNTPKPSIESSSLKFNFLDTGAPQSKFSMTIYFWVSAAQLVYQRALYSSERMQHLLDQLNYLIEQVVADPDRPIQSYSLVLPESRSPLPDPSLELPEPRYPLLTEMFSSCLRQWPEQPAIRHGARAWTYRDLYDSAHHIARVLLSQNLAAGDVVAVMGAPSFGFMAGVIGVLLGRGTLLLLDRNLPVERLRLMLQAAKVKQVLYAGSLRPEDQWVKEVSPVRINYVDADRGQIKGAAILRSVDLPELLPEDAAYISFTSGTTGTPKGVLGCHKGLSHFLSWQRKTFDIGPGDRVAQLTSYSFDVIFRELFLPVVSGATLCLPEAEYEYRDSGVLTWLEQEGISVLHTVPSVAQSWLADVPSGIILNKLRYLFFAGEPLRDTLVRRWRETFPETGSVINLYGPSETTLAKCFYLVPEDALSGIQPIGGPLPDTQALVLSERKRLCGIGEVGEIVIRTPFRSRGYIDNTGDRQRFAVNHFRNDESDLLYYTGDRGRYRLDGSLEILGRMDNQIKIHGIRIEPEEIEARLRQHPLVDACIVTAIEVVEGDKRLVAYVISKQESRPPVSELRNFLQKTLPRYSIPSSFVMLDQLPLTPNGKVDRRSLPIPDQSRPGLKEAYVRPSDVLELQLVQIWEELLAVRPIGTRDNFFDLGGHSLLAVRLMIQIEKRFGQKLPLAALFQGSTVKHLAGILRRRDLVKHYSPLVAIQPKGTKPPFYCVHPAGGTVLCYTDLARELGPEQPFYGLQTPGYEGEREPYATVEELAINYIDAICDFQPEGPYFIGGWSLGAVVAFEMARQFHLRGRRVGLLVLMDHKAPLTTEDKPTERDEVTLLLQACGDELTVRPEELAGLSALAQLAYIVERAKENNMMPDEITIEQVRAYIRIYQANTRALLNYAPQIYPGRITLFRAGDQQVENLREDAMGWKDLALAGVDVRWVPGKHSNMVRDPHAAALAACLKIYLDEALKENSSDSSTPSPNQLAYADISSQRRESK